MEIIHRKCSVLEMFLKIHRKAFLMKFFVCKVAALQPTQYSLQSKFFEIFPNSFLYKISSNRSQIFFKIDVFESFAIYTGKHLCLFLIKFQVFRPATFLKRDFITNVFQRSLPNFRNTFFSQHTFGGCFWNICKQCFCSG